MQQKKKVIHSAPAAGNGNAVRLADYLSESTILTGVHAVDKWPLLETMSEVIMRSPTLAETQLNRETVFSQIKIREEEHSTGVGKGCAFPHARLENLQQPVACLAVLHDGIDFNAIDGEPVRIVCMLLVPQDQPAAALKVMAELSQLLSSDENRRFFLSVENPEALYRFLCALEHKEVPVLTAGDIMRPPHCSVYMDTPLTQVTRIMQRHQIEAACIVDHENNLVGEITCDLLFQSGMPDFFSQLQSISFLRKFDPLEKYFQREREAVASDIMSPTFSALPEDATLLEVIFELAIRRHAKVYVVRDGKLKGIIDRIGLLDRVINF